jgi:hypothetical protein
LARRRADPNAACALLTEAIAERAGDFDVIHSQVDWLPPRVLSRTGVPFLTTVHGRLRPPGLHEVIRGFSEGSLCFDFNWSASTASGRELDCDHSARTAR